MELMSSDSQILTLKPGKEKSVRLRHPWIYSGALVSPPRSSGPARLADAGGRILATGFAEKKASIAFRVAVWGEAPVDLKAPAVWKNRFARAFDLRRSLIDLDHTDCFRLIHGEADGVPGVVADVYGDCLVFQSGWAGAESCVPVWVDLLKELGFSNIFRKKTGSNKPGKWNEPEGLLCGRISGDVMVRENDIRFAVDLEQGQKTGLFLDQRDNRWLIRQLSAGKRVANTFCYTGGFSLAAALGDAAEVISVDVSQNVLDRLQQNWRINQLTAPHHVICADAFKWLRTQPKNDFDLLVLDPPAFATSKSALPRATRGYKEILMQGIRTVSNGGMVAVFSCSQHISPELLQKIAFGAARDVRREVLVLKKLSAGMDHPFSLYHPEGEYLKGLLLKV